MSGLVAQLLPTTVIGAHGRPSWLHTAKGEIAGGRYGPIDTREALDDAVDIAILDQTRAGIDIITDGEMRREGFLGSFGQRIAGLQNVGPLRRVGEVGLDMEPILETTGPVEVFTIWALSAKPVPLRLPAPSATQPP